MIFGVVLRASSDEVVGVSEDGETLGEPWPMTSILRGNTGPGFHGFAAPHHAATGCWIAANSDTALVLCCYLDLRGV